ncbi:glycerol-3-phosphate dehydrogenase [NAD(P)+] [Amylibacter ulvae]|uniref:Glycerol-3-phosphate dehydrogenase [NAD(P)+] n=1 Tax=Paramylibacter ulvae TaxID=1651968 RepID=A0ABQ3D354_9RHOB|nr:NAD(P)H-dependent glycerol-3-phosphate dehydrogenase [Amylibacter ulvae]GHA48909.1 glycerol-3-phosphate dehydrogenase [NAD(P)+] [Amylibacter ulvae]
MNNIGVIGAGAFGTAMAYVFANDGNHVTLWGRDQTKMDAMAQSGVNADYLPDLPLPNGLLPTSDFTRLSDMDAILMVVPAQQLRGLLTQTNFDKITCPIIFCAKGIETDSGKLQTEIGAERLPNHQLAVITGPGFAGEIASGKPTALTIAADDPTLGERLQEMLSTPSLRLYLSNDMRGAQLGGALKNVLAIACGIVAGSGLGQSAQAALMTRGFAETSRLGLAMGAKIETLSGLSGFGDLVLTCTSKQSRNFSFGYTLGQTGAFSTGKTYEGVATAKACLKLAEQFNVEMPIAQTVADILDGQMDVPSALTSLMSRPLKAEN